MVPNGTHPHKIEVSWDQVFSGDLPENPAQRLFTATVITVAAQAKAALPEANGRVDRARDLVLGGLVSRNADGTFVVRSQSERGKSYTVNGSCTCPDAEKAPDGHCKHLVATWIWRKSRKLLEQQLASEENGQHATAQPAEAPKAEQSKAEATVSLPEAPASCNVYVTLAGRKVQLTLRDSDEQHMLARLEQLLQRFPAEDEAAQEPAEGWCSKHGVQIDAAPQPEGFLVLAQER